MCGDLDMCTCWPFSNSLMLAQDNAASPIVMCSEDTLENKDSIYLLLYRWNPVVGFNHAETFQLFEIASYGRLHLIRKLNFYVAGSILRTHMRHEKADIVTLLIQYFLQLASQFLPLECHSEHSDCHCHATVFCLPSENVKISYKLAVQEYSYTGSAHRATFQCLINAVNTSWLFYKLAPASNCRNEADWS